MDIKTAIKLLKHHNKWRNGADVEMVRPDVLTEVMNTIVNYYDLEKCQ